MQDFYYLHLSFFVVLLCSLKKETVMVQKKIFKSCIHLFFVCISIALWGESAEKFFHQANRLFNENKIDEAIQLYQQALILNPENPQIHFNCGIAFFAQKKYNEAIDQFCTAIELNGQYIKAYVHLGNTYLVQHKRQKAEEAYRNALFYEPKNIEALLAIAHLLHDHNEFDQAEYYFLQALELQPHNVKILLDCANSLNMNNKVEKALKLYNKIIELRPKNTSALYNIAYSLKKLGKVKEALELYKKVLELNPHHHEAHFGKGITHLIMGDFEQGWPEYEWRWKRNGCNQRIPSASVWNGSDVNGKTIIILAEQGLGDTFQFIRYAQVIKQMGATVIAMVQTPLVQLLSLCPYIDKVVPLNSSFDSCDYYISLLSIPAVMHTTLDTIPHNIPYLYADKQLEAYWQKQLAANTHFKIGICWQGNANYSTHFLRTTVAAKSISLELFKPLLELPQVTVYSLQHINGIEQIKQLPSSCQLITFDNDFDTSHGRFMDTAALIKNLDLVITVDTSIAHLAAGLGVPTWILLPEPSDWRWMLDRYDSPWYPTNVRLFRQPTMGDWSSVITQITQELAAYIHQRSQHSIVTAEISIGELVDKITILRIKQERINDEAKLKNINTELHSLERTYKEQIPETETLHSLTEELLTINKTLWDIEDDIREKEYHKQFDEQFIQLARRVYFTNDHRGTIKRIINTVCGSRLIEEKSYATY